MTASTKAVALTLRHQPYGQTLGRMRVRGRSPMVPPPTITMTRRRDYHDESFGFRKPRQYEFPDCESFHISHSRPQLIPQTIDTPTQLANRAKNAALLRYVDSMRTHGHRAARIDPLDLIHRDDVAALSPARYGLTDPDEKFDVNGILWTRRVGQGSDEPEMWTLREIEEGLRRVYVGNIAHEVRLGTLSKYAGSCF